MSFDLLGDLNWLAVIAATLAYFILGGIWYAQAVFGKAWLQASGIQIPEGQRPGAEFYVFPLISNFLMVLGTAIVARATGTDTFGEAVVLWLVVAVGFAVALTINSSVFDDRPSAGAYFVISAGYHLVGLLIAAVILSLWD